MGQSMITDKLTLVFTCHISPQPLPSLLLKKKLIPMNNNKQKKNTTKQQVIHAHLYPYHLGGLLTCLECLGIVVACPGFSSGLAIPSHIGCSRAGAHAHCGVSTVQLSAGAGCVGAASALGSVEPNSSGSVMYPVDRDEGS